MEEPSQLKRALIDASAGAISGAISRSVTSPLDVIKIRFQVINLHVYTVQILYCEILFPLLCGCWRFLLALNLWLFKNSNLCDPFCQMLITRRGVYIIQANIVKYYFNLKIFNTCSIPCNKGLLNPCCFGC